jgi:hypothetical protein
VAKIISVTIMNLATPKAGAKHELLFNKPAFDYIRLCVLGEQGKLRGYKNAMQKCTLKSDV